VEFGHFFGKAHQQRHRAKRLPAKIQIQARHDNAHTACGQRFGYWKQIVIEELGLVDGDDGCIWRNTHAQVRAVSARLGHVILAVVRSDTLGVVAAVDLRLEDLHILPGDLGAAYPADQLFGFAAEHAPANDFDAASMMLHAFSRLTLSNHNRAKKK
jgi:hypothetical protein